MTRASRLPLALWAALAATFCLRTGFAWSYVAQQLQNPLRAAPFAFEPGNIARALATGHGFASPLGVASGPTAWVAPVYPTLLAGLFHLFGVASSAAFIAATVLNILLVTLLCLPLYAATRALARKFTEPSRARRAGLIACWLWAIYPNAILLTYQSMWDGCLSALLGICLVWATLHLREQDGRWTAWVLYGLLWGVTLLTNPVFLAVLPVLLAWLLARRPRAALSVAVIVLAVLPWTLRNLQALHAFVPLRSDLGLALWLGNNADSTVPWHGQQHPLDDLQQRALFLRMGEVPYMRAKFTAGLDYMAAHPATTAHRGWQRLLAFWSGGAVHPVRVFLHGGWRTGSAWQNRYVLACDLLFGLGGLLGVVLLFRRRVPGAWVVAVFPLLIPCAYYLTEAIPRYRLAIDPEVILLAACWLTKR